MSTKYIVLLLGLVTVATLSLPSIAEVCLSSGSHYEVYADEPLSKEEEKIPKLAVAGLSLPEIKVIKSSGSNYKVIEQETSLLESGEVACGYYKTTANSMLELKIDDQTRILLHPETEIELAPMGASWPEVLDFHILQGEVDFQTTADSGKNLRILVNEICVNPLLVNFKVKFNSYTSSGEIVVKEGLLRATSNTGSGRYCTLPTYFRVSFSDGIMGYPSKAQLQKYEWKF